MYDEGMLGNELGHRPPSAGVRELKATQDVLLMLPMSKTLLPPHRRFQMISVIPEIHK
jgi:hypothetical protein